MSDAEWKLGEASAVKQKINRLLLHPEASTPLSLTIIRGKKAQPLLELLTTSTKQRIAAALSGLSSISVSA